MSILSTPTPKAISNYLDVLKHPDDQSSVWYYFLKADDGSTAKCKNMDCMKILRCKSGNTTGLHVHLKSAHNIVLKKEPASTSTYKQSGSQAKIPKITSHFRIEQRCLDRTLARMASKDGIPFSVFCTSKDLRLALKSNGFIDLPSSPNAIKTRVTNYERQLREETIKEIQDLKISGKRFSLTFDEWTSKRNRRYLNVYLHAGGSKLWNLGLTRIQGSTSADHCLGLVRERLQQFSMNLEKDIVSIATDGTSMMTKIGKLSPTHQQLCYAHGIQLAVVDVLYSKSVETGTGINCDGEGNADPGDINIGDDSDEEEEDGFTVKPAHKSAEVAHVLLKPVVAKVRKIVKMFKKSPLKNDTLLQRVREHLQMDLGLVLDSKTRWTSLVSMLERFHKLKTCVSLALEDLDAEIQVYESEWQLIQDVIQALQPVKATVETICRRDADLFSADVALKFMVEKLESQDSDISRQLATAMIRRIAQRRTDASGALKYLYKGELFSSDKRFGTQKSQDVATLIRIVIERLAGPNQSLVNISAAEEVNLVTSSEDSLVNTVGGNSKTDMQQELDLAIQQEMVSHAKPRTGSAGLLATIKKEMNLFQGGGLRGANLNLAFEHLKTIPPTSVESERAFSAAAYICNKVRSSLNDDTLNCLCVLRAHFQLNEN